MVGSQSRSVSFREKKMLGRPVRSLVTISTELPLKLNAGILAIEKKNLLKSGKDQGGFVKLCKFVNCFKI